MNNLRTRDSTGAGGVIYEPENVSPQPAPLLARHLQQISADHPQNVLYDWQSYINSQPAMRMNMSPTLRVVASWVCVAAGGIAMAFGSPWFFPLGLVAALALRNALRPPIPHVTQRARPVLSLLLIIAFLSAIAVIGFFFPESTGARVFLWVIGTPLMGYLMYDDIRVSRQLERCTG